MQWKFADSRRVLSSVLLLAGLVLLVYVGAQYGSMYRAQQRLARQWEEQQRNPHQEGPMFPGSSAVSANPFETLTRLTIPKIGLDAIVVEGTSEHALLLGPGHMEDTAQPGEIGNAVISAHRDTFFRHIYELQPGDSILAQRGGKTYTYEVTGKEVIPPDDFGVVRQSKEARLTLLTCYPIFYVGPAPERLAVFAKLADKTPRPAAVSAEAARSADGR